MDLQEAATVIMARCQENGAGGTEQAQLMALAEETGEFVGAMRRWRGLARRRGTEAEAQAELADVIISAYAMAEVMGWDVDRITQAKLEKILNRSWKEPESVPPGPCMQSAPGLFEGVPPVTCSLLAGHAGGHTNGVTSWTRADDVVEPMTPGGPAPMRQGECSTDECSCK